MASVSSNSNQTLRNTKSQNGWNLIRIEVQEHRHTKYVIQATKTVPLSNSFLLEPLEVGVEVTEDLTGVSTYKTNLPENNGLGYVEIAREVIDSQN